jgi:hypothetical protein
MRQLESQLQAACVRWFRYQYPKLDMHLYAIPNGGLRNKVTAARLKAEGVISGPWDLHLALPVRGYAGLWIEMKHGRNDLTDNQKAFREKLGEDYKWAVCWNLDQFMEAVNDYLKQ